MNLEDLAKKTISEVSSIIEEQRKQSEILKEQEEIRKTQTNDELEFVCEESDDLQILEEDKISIEKLQDESEEYVQENKKIEEEKDLNAVTEAFNEDIFLKHLRERILVLFEGLNSIKKDELENRLNLTINFLEFLLANIENKLKK